MKTALVIPIFNRPLYVKQCFDSLLKLTTKPDSFVLVNDSSTDKEIEMLIQSFIIEVASTKSTHQVIRNKENSGVKISLQKGIDYSFVMGADIVINLDSDAIVKPDFIEQILGRAIPEKNIVSGFNYVSATNPTIRDWGNHCSKPFCNGINMCFNRIQYEKYVKPSLLQSGNWDYNTSLACQADNLPFIITIPSIVQHIGIQSSMGHIGADIAQDFKQLDLPNVTLFGIDSHDPKGITRAAEICQRDIQFGAVKIITDNLFKLPTDRRAQYSRFMLKELTKHFDTSHVLTIHADGYVIDWSKWDNSWLEFDYIGASWWYKDGMNVGNGGFSLRSKKLCDILATQMIPDNHMHPEDHCICRVYRESLECDFGIKFAPAEVADRFSIETYGTPNDVYSGQFGFHGVHVKGIPHHLAYKK